jgi:hypothetical protein
MPIVIESTRDRDETQGVSRGALDLGVGVGEERAQRCDRGAGTELAERAGRGAAQVGERVAHVSDQRAHSGSTRVLAEPEQRFLAHLPVVIAERLAHADWRSAPRPEGGGMAALLCPVDRLPTPSHGLAQPRVVLRDGADRALSGRDRVVGRSSRMHVRRLGVGERQSTNRRSLFEGQSKGWAVQHARTRTRSVGAAATCAALEDRSRNLAPAISLRSWGQVRSPAGQLAAPERRLAAACRV